MVRLDDQLIVCGGHTLLDSSRCLNSVEVFNLELQQWSYITPMRKDCAAMQAVGKEVMLYSVGVFLCSFNIVETSEV